MGTRANCAEINQAEWIKMSDLLQMFPHNHPHNFFCVFAWRVVRGIPVTLAEGGNAAYTYRALYDWDQGPAILTQ